MQRLQTTVRARSPTKRSPRSQLHTHQQCRVLLIRAELKIGASTTCIANPSNEYNTGERTVSLDFLANHLFDFCIDIISELELTSLCHVLDLLLLLLIAL